MYISQTAGIIGAANPKRANPLRRIGEITAVKRIVLTMQQAGIFPIVIITGAEEDEVRWQLAGDNVIFIPAADSESPSLLQNVQIGIRFLIGKCDSILFTPVNAPLFTAQTILKLCSTDADIATPSFRKESGHPVLIRNEVFPEVFSYKGANGLRGLFHSLDSRRIRVPVPDAGILSLNLEDEPLMEHVPEHNQALLHPSVRISLGSETAFFDSRLKLLLFLISSLQNVRLACESMAISKGKAWNMINALEEKLGFPVVTRKQGGRNGGRTSLTIQGEEFLLRWQKYEEEIYRFSQESYHTLFSDLLPLPSEEGGAIR